MGAQCCAGQETKDGASGATAQPKSSPMAEETVKGATTALAGLSGKREWVVTVYKSQGGPRLGVDVDLGDGVSLLVDHVTDGLVSEWNRLNPEKAVRKDDRIVAVNGTAGSAQEIAEICKRDDVLNMTMHRDSD